MSETASGHAPTLPAPAPRNSSRHAAAPIASPVTGQPIVEPPPIIEPVGFDGPFDMPAFATQTAETRPIVGTQRPMRRRFLAPVASPASACPDGPAVSDPDEQTVRPQPPVAAAAPIAAEPVPMTDVPPVAPASLKQRNRPVVLGLEIAALVLLVAAGAFIARPDLFGPVRDRLSQLAGWPAALPTEPPPADPVQRLAYNMRRAQAGYADAALALGIQYAKGEGTTPDFTAAAKWFRIAADDGLTRAQYDLGVLYERGRGVPLDYAQAVIWYKRAAEGKYPLAQYNLAVAYTKGKGVERNLFEAAVWYHRAALQGVIPAMRNLAILYERGEGVEASPANAYAWYRAAARRGNQPSAERADELLQAFNASEQTQAEIKTGEVALSVQDPVGDSHRNIAQGKIGPVAVAGAPILKSGFDKEANPLPGGDAGGDLSP